MAEGIEKGVLKVPCKVQVMLFVCLLDQVHCGLVVSTAQRDVCAQKR